MAYLLDSNIFVDAKNHYYRFGVCPCFWDWLIRENANQRIYSIQRVKKELLDYDDELSQWARERDSNFFLEMDADADEAFRRVSTHVNNLADPPVMASSKRVFLDKADPILIAYALAHGHHVVTNESSVGPGCKSVKIPNICRDLGVQTEGLWNVLSILNANFVLPAA